MGPGKHLCLTGWKQIWTLGGEVLGLHGPPEVAWSSSASREREKEAPDVGKLANAFADLVQCLNDRSLALVLREEKDDGRKALQVLREHYQGKGKPRIIALYTELTSLEMREGESITDYSDNVMATKQGFQENCFKCGKRGHKSKDCYSKAPKWCHKCRTPPTVQGTVENWSLPKMQQRSQQKMRTLLVRIVLHLLLMNRNK